MECDAGPALRGGGDDRRVRLRPPALSIPVKQLALIKGTQGTLTFGGNAVVYDTPIAPRTWRYSDIQFIC